MAKRVFELAKELGVKSKAILEKCQAEGIPMTNHMSSISVGLEATVREWFSDTPSDSSGAAVETAAAVDLEQARTKAKPKAKAKKATAKQADNAESNTGDSDGGTVATLTETPEAAPAETTAKADDPTAILPPTPMAQNTIQTAAHTHTPATGTPAADSDTNSDTGSDTGTGTGTDGGTGTPLAPAAKATEPAVVNVPTRPKIIAPAGPQLSVQQPAKLAGPKVVRVEAPDHVPAPRTRRPAHTAPPAGGGGVIPQPGAPGGGADDGRNKRRGGPSRRSGGRGDGGSGSGGRGFRAQDLAEREARLERSGGLMRQRRRDMKLRKGAGGPQAQTAAQTGGAVKVTEPFTIKDLSAQTGVKASEIIKKLFLQGVMATVNSGIETEQAQEIMLDYNIELEVAEAQSAEEAVLAEFEEREVVDEQPRWPVVAILGHVDHGKTSLLDKVRNASVADQEAGGITQATSAFRVPVMVGEDNEKQEKHVVFLDTPGHQAFTAMRARGAHTTDIVVLVVAADDGVMPQTAESISHAQAAGAKIVVALNKVDRPDATEQRIQSILGQLAERGLNPVEWGGDTEVVRTSAATGMGVQELLEMLDFQSQLLELTADFGGPARGAIIESAFQPGRGPVANVLVQDGELNIGDFIVAGRAFGRVRDITNDRGERIKVAGPSTPVQISGLDELPDAGDKCYAVATLKKAQEAAEQRRDDEREKTLAQPKVTLESMLGAMGQTEAKELRVVVKADVQGSVDVLRKTAEEISTEDVRVRVLHAAVGGITESDVLLADASEAVIIGFNVIPASSARRLADEKQIQIRSYQVIYDIVDDLKRAAEGLLEPDVREEVLGHAQVRKVFKVSKVGAVAGCYVTDGEIVRNALIRVTRNDIVIEHDRVLEQLKRFKDDAKEVRSGQECGMKIAGYDDIKDGDILECYRKVEVKRTL